MADQLNDQLDRAADGTDDAENLTDRVDGRIVNSTLLYAARAYGG
jgi:hypothetical protein